MARYSLNEALKAREERLRGQKNENQEMTLDDVARVKVLSPGRKVFKRFIRNRLAIFGSVTLIILFVFSFLGPVAYPYGQKQIFYRYDVQNVNYGLAKLNETFTGFVIDDGTEIDRTVENSINSIVKRMIAEEKDINVFVTDSGSFTIDKYADNIYMLNEADLTEICNFGTSKVEIGVYDAIKKTITYNGDEIPGLEEYLASSNVRGSSIDVEFEGVTYQLKKGTGKTFNITSVIEGTYYKNGAMDAGFEEELAKVEETGNLSFEYSGKQYVVSTDGTAYTAYELLGEKQLKVYSTYSLDFRTAGTIPTDEFRREVLLAVGECGEGTAEFQADGSSWTLTYEDGMYHIKDSNGDEYAELTTLVIRRYSGEDTMEYDLKKAIAEKVEEMLSSGLKTATLQFRLPMQDENSKYVYDEDGNLQYSESDIEINRRDTGEFVIKADQVNYVIDMYSAPSFEHILGTDGDGFDVMSRIMYGGRISLMVGFVVVFLETFLGIIMGGLAGYYGKWVDNLIMRLVDIFYCLPSMPIMIILGTMMDAMRMDTYLRLIIMMAALGIMGWAGVARLVRGQILSLREQEFMVAAEATGIKTSSRIFRHLVPNVMPQLIVTATMGVGGVILMESTLSFLGLGVKHPLATWGTIINSVSSASAMAHYAHIWIPVGLLICLTVIAFNFVGDGLRDAYDPRSKR